jgi:hypothetical protein
MRNFFAMIKRYCLFILLLTCKICNAQNLVPNPSFEDTLGCPFGVPDLEGKCQYWHSFRGTPDYFNTCSSNEAFSNSWGYQAAHTGQAYAGFGTYQVTVPNSAEQLGVLLISPLVIGTKYYLSFYISPAFNYLYTNIATNKMGARLTTYQYSNPGAGAMPNSCTVKTDSIVKDSISWFKVFGSFIADSAYEYLIVGNFFDDNNIDTLNLPYSIVPQAAYYYVDDVCLSTDSIYNETWTSITILSTNKILTTAFPNPFNELLSFKTENTEINTITLFDIATRKLIQQAFTNSISLKTDHLAKGIYFYEIRNEHSVVFNGRVVKD